MMNDNGILHLKTLEYLNDNNSLTHDFLSNLEKRAEDEHRPIVQKEMALFLQQIVRMIRPKQILEIGTNFGYSTLCMALAIDETVQIETIEYLEENVIEAQKNFDALGIKNIKIIHSDALSYIQTVDESKVFDFVFIDANKSENQDYVEGLDKNLKKGSVLIVDNVLWKGQVTGQTEISKRHKNSTKAIRQFNEWMLGNKHFHSQILPIGDGALLAIKN